MRQNIAPRLFTKAEAAAYCGVSSATFVAKCPVLPIAFGHSKRLDRFDREALNKWIDLLGVAKDGEPKDWLTEMDRAMTIVRIKGVKRYRRRGKWYCYHRARGKRLKAEFGTGEFFAELARSNSGS